MILATARNNAPVRDEIRYLSFARNLTNGYYTDTQQPDLWFGPGLPILMAPLVALNLPLVVIRLTSVLFLMLMAVMFSRLMQLYVTPTRAWMAACILGLYFPFATLLPWLHTEPLVLFLITVFMYATQRYLHEGKKIHLLASGLALGWIALTRVAFGWVVFLLFVLFLLWFFIRPQLKIPRRLVLLFGVALLICVPWLMYTYSITGRVFYWGNSGGLSLYWMASLYPGDLGDWNAPPDIATNAKLTPHREFFEHLETLGPIEQDSELQRIALENIRSSPTIYLRNIAANISRIWFSFPFSYTEQKLSTLFYVIPNSILLNLVLLCLPVAFIRRRLLTAEVLPFLVLAAIYLCLHALLSAYARMLMPIVPILWWFVVYIVARHVRITIPADSDSVIHQR